VRGRTFSVAVSCLTVACGGFLGLDFAGDDGPPGDVTEIAADASTDGSLAESASDESDAASSSGDGALSEGGMADTGVDAGPVLLLPRKATFENKNLVSTSDGADQANAMMMLLGSGALYGTYSAQGSGGAVLSWFFDAAPVDELYLAVLFRVDTMPSTKGNLVHLVFSTAALLRTVDVGVDKSGNMGVAVDAMTPQAFGTVTKNVISLLGIHVHASTGVLEVIVGGPMTKLSTATRTSVTAWSTSPPLTQVDLVANVLGATYDEVHLRSTGFPN